MADNLVQLRSYHGATPGIGIDILGTTITFQPQDEDYEYSAKRDGLQIPPPGGPPVYSYVKNFRLYAVEEPVTFIRDVKLYFGAQPKGWSGVRIYVRTSGSYLDPIAQGQNPLPGFENNAVSYREDSPLLLTAQTDTQGAFGEWIQMQLSVTGEVKRPGIPTVLPFFLEWNEWETS